MRNFIQPGVVVTATAPRDLTAGDAFLLGKLCLVACNDADETESVDAQRTGVFELAKTSAQAWTAGDKIYYNTGTNVADNLPTTGPLIGLALEDAANPSSTGIVMLNGTVSELLEGGSQGSLTDLTDSTGYSGTHDDTLAATTVAALTATNPDAIVAAAGEATAADLTTTQALEAAVSALVVDITALRATVIVMAQNASDQAQKTKELVAILTAAGLATAP